MTIPKWLLPCLLTLLCWGGWAVVYKVLGASMSAAQSQAFSTLGILPIVLLLAATPGRLTGTRKLRGSVYALASGLLSALGTLAYYQAIEEGGKASTAASLTAVYPMTTVVLGMLLLHENPRPLQVAGIAGSLGAIYLFNVGEGQAGEILSPWVVYTLAPIFLWGSAALLQKLSTDDISAELSTCWFLGAFVPVAAVILATRPIRWSLPADAWLLVTALGALYGLGNLTLLAAYRNQGKASIVTPLSGLYPLVAIPLAVLVLGEQVGLREWAGIALALAAALALSYEKSSAPGTELATAHELPLSTGS
jgi:drug/metabolite transporter (DMT)-like permease